MEQRPNINIKQANQKLVYKEIYKNGPYTRKDLAIRLNFSLPTLAQHIKTLCDADLIEEKFLGQESEEGAKVGRRARYLSCLPRAYMAVGMEIRAQKVGLILVDLFGNSISKAERVLAFEASDAYSKKLAEVLNDFLKKEQVQKDRVLGVGFSFHGVVSQRESQTIFSHKLPLKEVSTELLTRYIPYPTMVHENGYCAGITEVWSRKEPISAFYIWLGDCLTGINIQDGVVHHGHRFEGGQIGHMKVVKGGRQHFCGNRGCLDAYCSSDCLTEGYDTLADFFAVLEQGKEEAVTRWEEYLQILCTAIGNIHLITSSDIILGGPVSHYVKANEASIQRILAERDIYHEDGKYLQIAEAGEDSAIKGAALVFVKKFLKEM